MGKIVNKCRINEEVKKEYGIELAGNLEKEKPYDGIIVAVKHRDYLDIDLNYLKNLFNDPCVLIDVKGIYDKEMVLKTGFNYWRL